MKYFLTLFLFVISTKALKIDKRSYAENQLRGAEFEFARRLKQDRQAGRPDRMVMTRPTVNAYNNLHMNEIVFPVGILQSPPEPLRAALLCFVYNRRSVF